MKIPSFDQGILLTPQQRDALVRKNNEKKTANNFLSQQAGLLKSAAQDIRANSAQAKKNAAKMRMDMLKQQIEAMMKLAVTGKIDPATIARLAKELKSLVAEYGSAGGGASAAGAISTPQAVVEGGAESTTEATGELSAEAAAAGASPSVETVTSQPAEAAAAAAEAGAAATEASAAAATATAASATATEASKTAATEGKTQEAQESEGKQRSASSPSASSKSSGDSGDAAFLAQAKELAQKIKMLLAISKQNEASERKLKEAQQAVEEIDPAISKAEGNMAAESLMAIPALYDGGGEAVAIDESFGGVSVQV